MVTFQQRGASRGNPSFSLPSNDDVSTVRAWNCAFHNQQILLDIDSDNAKVLRGHVVLAHMPGSPHSLEDAGWES